LQLCLPLIVDLLLNLLWDLRGRWYRFQLTETLYHMFIHIKCSRAREQSKNVNKLKTSYQKYQEVIQNAA